jgi:hypothetical protein
VVTPSSVTELSSEATKTFLRERRVSFEATKTFLRERRVSSEATKTFLRERRVSFKAQKSFLRECRAKMQPKSKVKKLQSRSYGDAELKYHINQR